jgi:hypothetical protein
MWQPVKVNHKRMNLQFVLRFKCPVAVYEVINRTTTGVRRRILQ